MKKLYLLLLTMLLSMSIYAQEVSIGTGTSTQVYPLGNYYGFERSASLYKVAELQNTGNIAAISWYANVAGLGNRPIKIYLKETTANTLTASSWASLISGATLVYSGNLTPVMGWNPFVLTSLFNYSGNQNNLLVLVEANFGGDGLTGSAGNQIRYSNASNSHMFLRGDEVAPTNNGTLSNNRPNIKLSFGPMVTCFSTSQVNVSNIAPTTATISWTVATPAPANGYRYEVRTSGAAGSGATGLVDSGVVAAGVLTKNLSSLTSNTSYSVYIQSICSSTEQSQWSDAKTFRTLCLASDVPYLENFDTYGTGTNAFPFCWFRPVVNAGYPSIVAANPSSTPNSLRFESLEETPTYAITPAFTENIQALRVKFKMKREGPNSGVMELGVMSNPADLSTFELVRVIDPSQNNLTSYITDLSSVTLTGANRHIALKHISNAGNWYYWVDDFEVTLTPSCLEVSNVNVSAITNNNATISWSASYSVPANGYEYEIRTSGYPGSGATGLTDSGTVTAGVLTKDVSSLVGNTTYSVYVRANCSTTDQSEWSEAITFLTLCDIETVPYIVEMPSSGVPVCFDLENVNDDSTLWTSAAAQTGITGRVMSLSASSTLASDDWFYLQGLQLTAGQAYRLSFKFKKGSASANQKLKVAYGLSKVNTAMTNQIVDVDFPNNTNAQSFYIDFIPTTAGSYYIGFHGYADASQGTLYVGEIKVENSPSCMEPLNVNLTDVTKNSVKLNWGHPTTIPSNGYAYEVRTSGEGGSGTTGLFQTGTASVTEIQKIISSLDPSTTYTVYLSSVCAVGNNSIWMNAGEITTLCNYPDFISTTSATICGFDSVTLTANFSNNELIRWFSSATGGSLLHLGANFVTPMLDETTSYFVESGNPIPNSAIQAGSGTATSSTYSNPFYSLWSNSHTQFIIRASELSGYGLAPGPITSVALNVTSAGTVPMKDLSIKIGNTTRNNLDDFDVTAVLNTVYTNSSYLPVTGSNTFQFSTPFVWDGVSNIVIEFCHGNSSSSGTMSRTIRMVSTDYNSAIKTHVSAVASASTICSDVTTNKEAYKLRPQFLFTGVGLCPSPRVEVVVTVNPAPVLELSDSEFEICEGNSSQVLSITEGATDYDVYQWNPQTGVAGNAQDGWTFNPTESTNYTLKVSQSSGDLCTVQKQVYVYVNLLPADISWETDYDLCLNDVLNFDLTFNDSKEFIIGTETTLTGSSEIPSAFMNRRLATKQQYIYSKQELNALGVFAGTIESLSFNINTLGSSASNSDYTIKMKSVSQTSFANTTFVNTDLITVFGPTTYTHTNKGWQKISFNTPFVWDGISDILVELTHRGVDSADNAQTYYTETTTNTGLVVLDGTTTSVLNATTGSLTKKRPNIKFEINNTSTVIWSPQTDLFLDQEATIPYLGQNVYKLYLKPTTDGVKQYQVLLTTTDNCDLELSTTVNVTESTLPVVSEQHFCNVTSVEDLVVTGKPNGIFKWYDSIDSIDAILEISETATYYVEQILNGCVSQRAAVLIRVDSNTNVPIAPLIQNFCGVVTVSNLAVSPINGFTIGWFDSEDATIPLLSNQDLTSGIYYVASYNGYCWSPKLAVQVNATPIPSIVDVEDITLCGSYMFSEVNLGQQNGVIVNWYSESNSMAPLPNTNNLVTGTYYVSLVNGICESPRKAINVVVLDGLIAPTAPMNQTYCGEIYFSDLQVTTDLNGTIGWFTDLISETPINLNDVVNSGTYYVAQTNGACWSQRRVVHVTINSVPAAPNAVNKDLCGTYTFADINYGQANDAVLNWYSTFDSTTSLSLSSILTTGTYFVSQTVNGCESERVQVAVLVADLLPLPVAPATQSFCGNTTFADLNVTANAGASIGWFTNANGTVPVPMTQLVSTGTYYVAQFNGVCWTDKIAIQVTVKTIPPVLNNTQQFLCGTHTLGMIQVNALPNADVRWYASAESNVELSTSSPITTGVYFVSQSLNGCESPRAAIQLTITDNLATPIATAQVFCGSGTVSDLVAQGVAGATIKWYSTSTATQALAPGTQLATGTYYVAQSVHTCTSARRAVSVRIISMNPPMVTSIKLCGNSTVADLMIQAETGVTFRWFNSPTNPQELGQFATVITGTYYVSRVQNGCETPRSAVAVTVGEIPNAPTGQAIQSFVDNAVVSDLTLDQSNITWYATYNNSQNHINPLADDTVLVHGNKYYAVIISEQGCPSLPFEVTIDIYLDNKDFVKSELKYYPNPVVDELHVTYSERIVQVEVFDLLGKRVKLIQTDGESINVDLSDLASATYMIQLKTENKQQFIKVVKK